MSTEVCRIEQKSAAVVSPDGKKDSPALLKAKQQSQMNLKQYLMLKYFHLYIYIYMEISLVSRHKKVKAFVHEGLWRQYIPV